MSLGEDLGPHTEKLYSLLSYVLEGSCGSFRNSRKVKKTYPQHCSPGALGIQGD